MELREVVAECLRCRAHNELAIAAAVATHEQGGQIVVTTEPLAGGTIEVRNSANGQVLFKGGCWPGVDLRAYWTGVHEPLLPDGRDRSWIHDDVVILSVPLQRPTLPGIPAELAYYIEVWVDENVVEAQAWLRAT